jgi:hypothetical protein
MKYAFTRRFSMMPGSAHFNTMAEYRAWCEANMPEWLGYGR